MKSSRRIGWALFLVAGLTFGSTLALSQSAVRDIALDARTGARLLPDSSIISGLTPHGRYSVKVTGSTTAPMQGLFFMYVDSVAARVRYTAIGDSFCFQPINGFYQLTPIFLDWVDSTDNVGTLTVTVSGPTTVTKQIDTRRHAIMIRNTYSGLPSQPVTVSVTENPAVIGTAVRGLFSMYQSSNSAIGFRYLEPGDEFHYTPIGANPQLGFVFLDWSTLDDNSGVFRIHTQLRSSTPARQLNARTDARLIPDSKIISGLSPGEIYRVAVSSSISPAPNTPMQGLFFMYVDIDTCMVQYVPSGQSFCFRPGANLTYQLAPIFLDWSDSTDNQGSFTVTVSGPTFTPPRVVDTRVDAIMIRNVNHLWSGLSTTRQYAISIAEQPLITGAAVRGLFTMSQIDSGFMFRYVEPGAGVVFAPAQSPIQFGAIFLDWSNLLDNGGVFQFYGADTVTDVTTNVTVPLTAGWNMISNPVGVTNDSVRVLYPTSTLNYAYAFSGGYVQDSTMENGTGYWEKFSSAITQNVTGVPITRDTFNVLSGWNMVGTISNSVDTSTIVSMPPGLRGSSWYGYNGAYFVATQLTPGKAYWVKANSAGQFVLANPLLARAANVQLSGVNPADVLNTLTITDSKGRSQTLFFGANASKSIQPPMYDMPPLPPVGAFDARFETAEGGSMVQTHGADVSGGVEFTVSIQSDAYPLTVSWKVKNASYELTDGRGGQVFRAKDMTGEASIKITNSSLNKFSISLVGDGQLPKEFALAQNYPNPFNPSTTIKYDLPKDSRVSLKLFNILGQEVAALVNEEQKAGYKSVQWNANNFASGVYFYRLQAGDFVETRKLLLLR